MREVDGPELIRVRCVVVLCDRSNDVARLVILVTLPTVCLYVCSWAFQRIRDIALESSGIALLFNLILSVYTPDFILP